MTHRHRILFSVVAIVALAAGAVLGRALLHNERAFTLQQGTLLDPARPLQEFTLVDHRGQPFTRAQLQGRWALLFFGFASCPDICPTTLAQLAQVEGHLAGLPPEQRPQIVLISVDPERDTPERLQAYVRSFSPHFVGITGPLADVQSFARHLGAPMAKAALDNGQYTVDHSAALFLIQPNAAMRALFTPPHSPEIIAADYRRIVTQSN